MIPEPSLLVMIALLVKESGGEAQGLYRHVTKSGRISELNLTRGDRYFGRIENCENFPLGAMPSTATSILVWYAT